MKAALAILLVLAATAYGDRKTAETYFRSGAQAYRAQNFDAAAKNFEMAYKELPLPEIAFSAAQAYRRQYRVDHDPDKLRAAVALYSAYLEKVKTGGRVADATDSIEELQRELDKIDTRPRQVERPKVEQTQIVVSVILGGSTAMAMHEIDDKTAAPEVQATATLDGDPIKPDTPTDVKPGEHVVRGEAPGYAPQEKKIRAFAGRTDIATLELAPLPARVMFDTDRGARISIDGNGVGMTPLAAVEVPAGKHVLTIVHTGREPVAREFEVARGQEVTLHDPLAATGRRRIATWIAIGDGVLAAATLGVSLLAAHESSAGRDLRDQIGHGDQSVDVANQYAEARDLRDQYRIGALALGATTVGVGLFAAWLYYYDRPSAEGMHVVPLAGPGTSGVMMTGRW